jgi:hypothetical protein
MQAIGQNIFPPSPVFQKANGMEILCAQPKADRFGAFVSRQKHEKIMRFAQGFCFTFDAAKVTKLLVGTKLYALLSMSSAIKKIT